MCISARFLGQRLLVTSLVIASSYSISLSQEGGGDPEPTKESKPCCIAAAAVTAAPATSLTVAKAALKATDGGPDDCGITSAPGGPNKNLSIDAVQSECKWLFGASASRDMRSGEVFAKNSITNICAASDAAVTNANFCSLVNKFYNGGSGDGGGDCFVIGGTSYGCKTITEAHEQAHVDEYTPLLNTEAAKLGDFALDIKCPDYDTKAKAIAARSAAIEVAINGAYTAATTAWAAQGEGTNGWSAEFPAAENLAKAICQRAKDDAAWDVDTCQQCKDWGYTD